MITLHVHVRNAQAILILICVMNFKQGKSIHASKTNIWPWALTGNQTLQSVKNRTKDIEFLHYETLSNLLACGSQCSAKAWLSRISLMCMTSKFAFRLAICMVLPTKRYLVVFYRFFVFFLMYWKPAVLLWRTPNSRCAAGKSHPVQFFAHVVFVFVTVRCCVTDSPYLTLLKPWKVWSCYRMQNLRLCKARGRIGTWQRANRNAVSWGFSVRTNLVW